MVDDGQPSDRERPANDNRPPDGQDAGSQAEAAERLDRVVMTIARLIGRQIAREHFETLQAANDNQPPIRRAGAKEDRSGGDDDS